MNYTIKEIAELTGVAKSTVSKALNGQKGVSKEKRQEILKLASKCNYVPNAAARALSHSKSETIGILISSDAESPEIIFTSVTNSFGVNFSATC